ncbi:MAG: hypothetical protein ABWY35_00550 [Pseudorhodoplanes sp.]
MFEHVHVGHFGGFVRQCEAALMVFQIQLAKRVDTCVDSVPLTRDYFAQEEVKLRGLERKSRAPLRMASE